MFKANLRTVTGNFQSLFLKSLKQIKGIDEKELASFAFHDDTFMKLIAMTAIYLDEKMEKSTLQDVKKVFSTVIEDMQALCGDLAVDPKDDGVLLSNEFFKLTKDSKTWVFYRFAAKKLIGKSKLSLARLTAPQD